MQLYILFYCFFFMITKKNVEYKGNTGHNYTVIHQQNIQQKYNVKNILKILYKNKKTPLIVFIGIPKSILKHLS